MRLPSMVGVKERMDYCLELGGVLVITGEVGSGKSTSLRWSINQYHPSEVVTIKVIAGSGTISELYRQISWGFDLLPATMSRSRLQKDIRNAIYDIVTSRKQKILLVVDEANLLKIDVFAEIHTLSQFDHDSRHYLSMVLCGQTNLLDKLAFRSSEPLASRVIARTHLDTLRREQIVEYLNHHLKIAGVKKNLYHESAVNAIHQGSGGILRKTNSLARGGLIAAAIENEPLVMAEHIRIAASELI